jgi:hypothetical protein
MPCKKDSAACFGTVSPDPLKLNVSMAIKVWLAI